MFKIYRYEDEENSFDKEEDRGESIDDDESLEEPFEEDEEQEEDPNFQGTIRTVTGACLIYKRRESGNKFEELWVYSTDSRNMKVENDIRNSILAGTDIDNQTQRSPEGDQTASTESVGNVQFLHIKGLPN